MHNDRIDVDRLSASVQRFIPPGQAYISLPPGVDPATVDFRTFYPYNPSEVKHRKRTTRSQLKVLEDTFKHETKPNAALRKALATKLEMTPRGVQVWFQNRRAKEKALAKKIMSNRRPSADIREDEQEELDDDGSPSATILDEASPPASADLNTQQTVDSSSVISSPSLPKAEDVPPKREAGPSPTGLGISRTSWQTPVRQSVDHPIRTSVTPPAVEITPVDDDHFVKLRRGSLPTHVGLGPPPSMYRHRSHARHPYEHPNFDPLARRRSLDRLASHPFAHVAAAANGAVFGHSMRSVSFSAAPNLSPSHTPQPPRSDLPAVLEHERRPELMHRASMPAQVHPPRPMDFSRSPIDAPGESYRMRFPQDTHIYSLPPRTYQAPIPGPLPAPDFSFGTSTSHPSPDGEDPNKVSKYSYREGEFDVEDDGASYGGFSSRFGSITSIADSETSATSGCYSDMSSFDMRPSTSHSHQNAMYHSVSRRPSCTGQVMDMFSNLEVQNHPNVESQMPPAAESGPTDRDIATSVCSSPLSTLSGGSDSLGTNGGMRISPSSELSNALHPVTSHKGGSMGCNIALNDMDAGTVQSHVDSDVNSLRHSHRSNSSSSSFMYPHSAASSRSSLGLPQLGLDMEFSNSNSIGIVSDTGHYSPVSPHSAAAFEFGIIPPELNLNGGSYGSMPMHNHFSNNETEFKDYGSMGGHPNGSNIALNMIPSVDPVVHYNIYH